MAIGLLVAVGAGHASAGAVEWNVARVGGPMSGPGVVIAVVDTGVDASHPAFDDRVLAQINVVGERGDGHGHGTHVAGIAAGGPVNCGDGAMTIGVAPSARLLPVRVLDEEGRGSFQGVAEGIRRAADHDPQPAVINLSLGPELDLGSALAGDSRELLDAIDYAWGKGSIPVLAAGNDDNNLLRLLSPADFEGLKAVVVTATTRNDERASYADRVDNARWGIAAPGGEASSDTGQRIRSAWRDDQCAFLSGTSMATPHVSGALAVLRARGLSQSEAVDRVLSTARRISGSGTGAGLLDLRAAVAGIDDGSTTTTTTTTSTTAGSSTTTTRRSTTTAGSQPPSSANGPSTTAGAADAPDPSTSTATVDDSAAGGQSPTTDGSDPGSVPEGEAAADLSVNVDHDGSKRLAAAAAGMICAAMWVVVSRAALRLKRYP